MPLLRSMRTVIVRMQHPLRTMLPDASPKVRRTPRSSVAPNDSSPAKSEHSCSSLLDVGEADKISRLTNEGAHPEMECR